MRFSAWAMFSSCLKLRTPTGHSFRSEEGLHIRSSVYFENFGHVLHGTSMFEAVVTDMGHGRESRTDPDFELT